MSAGEPKALPDWQTLQGTYRRGTMRPLPPPDPEKQFGGSHGWAWTDHAHYGFIYPPVIRFPLVDGAVGYRLTVRGKTVAAELPVVDLAPLWPDMKQGEFRVRCEALDAAGKVLGKTRERQLRKKAPLLSAEAWPAVLDYRKAALRCLRAEFNDFPEAKRLRAEKRCSGRVKHAGGLAICGANLARCTGDPDEKEAALTMARHAAESMLREVFPADSLMAGTPRANRTQDIAIWAGGAFLDLHEASGEKRWLDAALTVAQRLAANMRPEGWWPGYLDEQSGDPVAELKDRPCIGAYIVVFLERLAFDHDREDLRPALEKAVAWLLANPAKSYCWEAQFDDMKAREAYVNLTGRDAVLLAQFLLKRRDDDPGARRTALDLVRFADCQFAFYRTGRDGGDKRVDPRKRGIVVREQYHFGEVNQTMMRHALGHAWAWKRTGDPVHLASALEIANVLVRNQWDNGLIGTYVYYRTGTHCKWINCPAACARDMLTFAEVLKDAEIPRSLPTSVRDGR